MSAFPYKRVPVAKGRAVSLLMLLFLLPGGVWVRMPGASSSPKPQGQLSSRPEPPATSQLQSPSRKQQPFNLAGGLSLKDTAKRCWQEPEGRQKMLILHMEKKKIEKV